MYAKYKWFNTSTNVENMQVYDVGKRIWTKKGEEHEVAKKEFIETFNQLEEALGEKPYFGGDTFAFADIALICFYSWFYAFESFGNFKMEVVCPKLMSWVHRCIQRERVSKILPDEKKVYEFVLGLRKKCGVEKETLSSE